MKRHPRISPAEWQVMKVIWAGSPVLAHEVIARLAVNRNWHAKTIRTLLARLVKKRVIGFEKQGRAYLYRPLLQETDCVRAESQSFLDRIFDGALVPMLAHFLQGREISDSQKRELRLLLGAKKKAAGRGFELSI
jgi:BlaI family penicillinase repressor